MAEQIPNSPYVNKTNSLVSNKPSINPLISNSSGIGDSEPDLLNDPNSISPEDDLLKRKNHSDPDLTASPQRSSLNVVKCMNSSMVHSFEYNESERILRVYFLGGQTYDYFFVPKEIAEEFKAICENPNESAGKWFARTVRRSYQYMKIT